MPHFFNPRNTKKPKLQEIGECTRLIKGIPCLFACSFTSGADGSMLRMDVLVPYMRNFPEGFHEEMDAELKYMGGEMDQMAKDCGITGHKVQYYN